MTRTSRWDFLDSRKNREKKQTRREIATSWAKDIRKSLIAKKMIPDPAKLPPRKEFLWVLGNDYGTVRANTRSEARGAIKKQLGIKGRLPVEMKIREVDNPNPSTGAA